MQHVVISRTDFNVYAGMVLLGTYAKQVGIFDSAAHPVIFSA